MTRHSPEPLRISIADDHRMFVEAMRLILDESPDVEVVSVAQNGDDLLRDIHALKPDVALVDISMPGPGYLAIASKTRAIAKSISLVALTMHLDRDLADRVIGAGFQGYVIKDAAVAELLEAIQTAAAGQSFISRSVMELRAMDDVGKNTLTPRELECVRHAGSGWSNRDIAQRLGISERTVKFHFENVFKKLDVKSRGEAVSVVRQNRLIAGI